ncbi:MAG: homoserine dehydrogenase [Thermonemataceae bacterium]|nr:homoserine dehydrogenase [Thermonemataceae bacterium]
MEKKLKIGMFGFGCVGQGLYDIFTKTDFQAEIQLICVKDKSKKRSIDASYFTYEKDDILDNPEINLVVEMIDDAEAAYEIVKKALLKGKNVVTANKKMVALHIEELVEIQQQTGTSLLYEAAACGSIPIIRTLAEYYDNEWLYSVSGIFNGTSNYILTKVIQENLDYPTALKQAQELGFAETDPTADVGAFDPLYKLCLVVAQAYGKFIPPQEIFNYGISSLAPQDIQYAKEKGLKIKLIAAVSKVEDREITLSVMPYFVDAKHYLYNVENEYNGVVVEAAFSDKQIFIGKGAGGHPTGSAVLSDISACRYDYRYEYRKAHQQEAISYTRHYPIEVYLRYQDERDIADIDFYEISEQHIAKEFKYVIAVISLEQLFELKTDLPQRNIFIANTGRRVAREVLLGTLENKIAVSDFI